MQQLWKEFKSVTTQNRRDGRETWWRTVLTPGTKAGKCFNHMLGACLSFPWAVWDPKACSWVKRRPDLGLGRSEILLETKPGLSRRWAARALGVPRCIKHLSSISSELQKCFCAPAWTNENCQQLLILRPTGSIYSFFFCVNMTC